MSKSHMNGSPALLSVLLAVPLGCVVQIGGELDVGDEASASVGSSEGEGEGESSDDASDDKGSEPETGPLETDTAETDTSGDACVEAVDILFVIDNSGSMGASQRQIAQHIGAMVERLEQAGMSWRIGVTTTDNGNPWCPAGTTTPEAGKLVASSCRSRLGDFLFSDTVDVRDAACRDLCETEQFELANDQPWVESSDGVSNTPDPIEALECMLPQGVNGCGFESQLESMRLALARAQDPSEASFGFLRPEAQLAVVIVSDEVDCSYNPAWVDMFAQDGNKAFWSDPNASFPTSAVCWNAGVTCSGVGPEFANCVAADKDITGQPTADPAAAVLHPISRYTDLLEDLRATKQSIDPAAEVRVFGILGVGLDGLPHYVDVSETDPTYHDSFGVGPGCEGPVEGESAVPPVRMRSVVNQLGGSMHSICKDQFADALVTIANRVALECL
jgi:hypothetical protein